MSSRPAATRRSKSSSPSAASAPTRPLPRPVPRVIALGRLPGGDERAVRAGEEARARPTAGLSRPARLRERLPAARKPLRPGRRLPPRLVTRHPGADPQVRRRGRERRPQRRDLGQRRGDPGVPLRRRCRRRDPAGSRAHRNAAGGQHRHGPRDIDPRARRVHRTGDRLRGRADMGPHPPRRPGAPRP